MLTRRQHELLLYINKTIARTGISPSFENMKQALGLKSKSGIHRLVTGLVERGFLHRLPNRARALRVLQTPEDASAKPGEDHSWGSATSIPLYGRIAAGTPIEAISFSDSTIDTPPAMLGPGEHYALEISGDSMVNAGILDGDIAVIRRAGDADNGTIVVALIDKEEATLKRLRRKGNSIALEPENPNYETRIFGPDRIEVQGTLVGILRKY